MRRTYKLTYRKKTSVFNKLVTMQFFVILLFKFFHAVLVFFFQKFYNIIFVSFAKNVV